MKNKELAIKGILSDYIIWYRISNSMFDILSAYDPGVNENWKPADRYQGYNNVFYLLEINKNDDLCRNLSELTLNIIANNEQKQVNILAGELYNDWMMLIVEKSIVTSI